MPRKRLRPSSGDRRSRPSRRGRHSARNPSGAPAAGRCRARRSPADRRARSGRRHRAPATARAMTASQSSIVIVPSGRSAMICTVQPSSPETLTRTSRNRAPRAPAPRSRRRAPPRRSPRSGAARRVCQCRVGARRVGGGLGARRDGRRCRQASGCRCLDLSCPAQSCAPQVLRPQVIKKSGSRAGPTLTSRSIIRPL